LTTQKDPEFAGWSAIFRQWFDQGKAKGATHIMYGYMVTGENQYFSVYVMPGEDARQKAKFEKSHDETFGQYNEAHFVFTFSRSFEEQWAETEELTKKVLNFD
jgi:hypothetical protein